MSNDSIIICFECSKSAMYSDDAITFLNEHKWCSDSGDPYSSIVITDEDNYDNTWPENNDKIYKKRIEDEKDFKLNLYKKGRFYQSTFDGLSKMFHTHNKRISLLEERLYKLDTESRKGIRKITTSGKTLIFSCRYLDRAELLECKILDIYIDYLKGEILIGSQEEKDFSFKELERIKQE